MSVTKGSCLCGNVRYQVEGEMRPVCYCHCNQCRKMSGHFVAASQCQLSDISIEGDVTWYQSSDTARRGFCAICSSSLFWQPTDGDRVSIFAGTIDGDTSGIIADKQLCSETKGEYYQLPDVPTVDQGDLQR